MAAPYTLESSLRYHDEAIYNWLDSLHLTYRLKDDPVTLREDEPVLRVFAAPSRPFAYVADLLVARNFFHDMGLTPEQMREMAEEQFHDILPLPIITIQRSDPVQDTELAGADKHIRKIFLDPTTGKWKKHPWPAHYRTEYALTIWSESKYTEAFILEWFYAQFGNRGASDNEAFIEVHHDAPWGPLNQSLKLLGMSDISELEGTEPRWLRHEVTVSLRTWIMRNEAGSADMIERIGAEYESPGPPPGPYGNTTDEAQELESSQTGYETMNLFDIPMAPERVPDLWQKTGDADVAVSELSPETSIVEGGDYKIKYHKTMAIQVEAPEDTVDLLERLALLDVTDNAILGMSFSYKSQGGDVEFEVHTREPAEEAYRSAFSLVLQPSNKWVKVHKFTVINEEVFKARIAGIGGQQRQHVWVSDIDMRVISTLTAQNPTGSSDLGDAVKYFWNGLENAPYLVIILVVSTTGGINELVAGDDAVNPDSTRTQVVDSAANVGAAFLLQPKHQSLALTVPKTVTSSAVFVQRFHGAFNGDEL